METTNNFMQIKEQTFEEKVEMYMQCDKKKLAEMLAMRDMIDEQKNKEKENIVEPYFPNKLFSNAITTTIAICVIKLLIPNIETLEANFKFILKSALFSFILLNFLM